MTYRLYRTIMMVTGVLLTCLAIGKATAWDDRSKVVAGGVEGVEDEQTTKPEAGSNEVVIRAIEPEAGEQSPKEFTWLGVSVEDASEVLAAQLGLRRGQGLVINYVAPDSPAAKAELAKNDVLVEFEGQMLVDPVQLRKLVQMHADGEGVKVTLYRSGKKQSVTARLAKKTWDEGSLQHGLRKAQIQMDGMASHGSLAQQMNALTSSLANLDFDKAKMKVEIAQSVEQTRKAIQDAMRHSLDGPGSYKDLGKLKKELSELAGGGVDLGNDSTVIIKNAGKPIKTIVKTDESGSYVIVADPNKHLIANDKDGKLLFDGIIESPQQRQKVPREVWQRIKPLVTEMDKGKMEDEPPAAQKVAPKNEKP